MKELSLTELDERLQKQVGLVLEALGKGGYDYAIQICGELLKRFPGAYEVRGLLWQAIHADNPGAAGGSWLRDKSMGMSFKLSARSLLKSNPQALIRRCDEQLRGKQVFSELFLSLDKAAEALDWPESRVVACRALTELWPDKTDHRLALARVLLDVERPQKAIEQLEWVLAREPANAEAQTLLKNASVAETLQRGNWEDTDTSFHTKKHT